MAPAPRFSDDRDDDADDLAGWDESDPEADDDGDDDPTTPCPACRRPVYDDAEWCPGCGQFLSREGHDAPRGKPWWLIVGVAACLAVVLGWVVR